MKKQLIIVIAMLMVFVPVMAMAADGPYTINLKDGVLAFVTFIFAVLSAVVGYVVSLFVGPGKKLPIDPNMVSYIEAGLQGAIRIAEQKALAAAKNINDPQVKSEIIADAANFVLKQIPKLSSFYGVTPENVRDLIVQRLGNKGVTNGPV